MRLRSSIVLFFILFADNFGFTIAHSILPLLLHPQNGILNTSNPYLHNLWIGLSLIAFPIGMFFAGPFFGSFSDKWGRKKALQWSLSGTFFGYCLGAIGILFTSYYLILFSRLFSGLFSGTLSVCLAGIADSKREKRGRAKYFSYGSALLGLSWLSALIIASYVIHFETLAALSLPFWAAAFLSLLSLAILFAFFSETAHNLNRPPTLKTWTEVFHTLEKRQLRILFLTLFFWFFGFYVSLQWIAPISLEVFHAPKSAILWILMILGFLWIFSSGLLNPLLLKQFSLWKILVWSLLLLSLFYFFSAITHFFIYFVVSYLIATLFAAMAWGNNLSLISFASSKENYGLDLGIGQSTMAIAQLFGPFFGGLVAAVDREGPLLFSSIFAFIGFLFLFIFVIQQKNRVAKSWQY